MDDSLSNRALQCDNWLRIELARRKTTQEDDASLVIRVMDIQEETGCWRSQESAWVDVYTARAIELLDKWEIDPRAHWSVTSPQMQTPAIRGLPLAFEFLLQSNSAGLWGTDWYDHAQVVRVLAKLKPALPAELADLIEPAAELLQAAVNRQFAPLEHFSHGSAWAGPATWAAASMAFWVLDKEALAEQCLVQLLDLQDDTTGGFDEQLVTPGRT